MRRLFIPLSLPRWFALAGLPPPFPPTGPPCAPRCGRRRSDARPRRHRTSQSDTLAVVWSCAPWRAEHGRGGPAGPPAFRTRPRRGQRLLPHGGRFPAPAPGRRAWTGAATFDLRPSTAWAYKRPHLRPATQGARTQAEFSPRRSGYYLGSAPSRTPRIAQWPRGARPSPRHARPDRTPLRRRGPRWWGRGLGP